LSNHHWYAFYPGDYGRDTAHLSLVEDGAYRRLLDYCYSTGKAIPADLEQAFRICRAFSSAEQDAVRMVLGQFFAKHADGYHNSRADREIVKQAEYRTSLSEAGSKGAAKRWGSSHANGHPNSPAIAEPQPQPQPNPEPKPKRSKAKACAIAPSLEEVKNYCEERQNHVDPEQWMNHYTANGWKVGRNPMKDWKAAVCTWEKNGVNNNGSYNKASRRNEILKKLGE
jgi:uncharacterized protein YdaU (DUF1376 family)